MEKYNPSEVIYINFNNVSLQSDNTEQGVSHSQFMSLVQNLLRDAEERSNFFQVRCDAMQFFFVF